MYKALNQTTEAAIIILDVEDEATINQLRQLDWRNQLLCPGCRRLVWDRAGDVRGCFINVIKNQIE